MDFILWLSLKTQESWKTQLCLLDKPEVLKSIDVKTAVMGIEFPTKRDLWSKVRLSKYASPSFYSNIGVVGHKFEGILCSNNFLSKKILKVI